MQAEAHAALPAPDPDSAGHSRRCAEFIRERIDEAGGAISFAEYMHHALYAPGLGYYAAGATKFGEAGDFVTAPEVSPLFGRVLARQVADVLVHTGGSILEFGAGSGRLAIDVLEKLAELDAVPEQYLILEISADLQQRQRQAIEAALPGLIDRVSWIDALPAAHRGVVLANEVLDALPVERFSGGSTLHQHVVVSDSDGFVFKQREAPAHLHDSLMSLQQDLGVGFAAGYASELSPGLGGWVTELLESMAEGRAFLFDYGLAAREYYAPDRTRGWLRCHFRHHAHSDPLLLPGIQDITAWVDFTAVASAAVDAGARVAGWLSQAHFLMAGGLEDELAAMSTSSQAEQVALSAGVKMLTLPGEMGEPFKCMMLDKGDFEVPALMQSMDRTHTL